MRPLFFIASVRNRVPRAASHRLPLAFGFGGISVYRTRGLHSFVTLSPNGCPSGAPSQMLVLLGQESLRFFAVLTSIRHVTTMYIHYC